MKKVSKSKLKNKLDKAFSQLIRKKGYCERCFKRENLQCAHIISRVHLSTRWLPLNAVVLCYACHIHWAHRNPIEFTNFLIEKIGQEALNELIRLSQIPFKGTIESYIVALRELESKVLEEPKLDI